MLIALILAAGAQAAGTTFGQTGPPGANFGKAEFPESNGDRRSMAADPAAITTTPFEQ